VELGGGREQFEEAELGFEKLSKMFKDAGFTDADIARELIECLKNENKHYQKLIDGLEQSKLMNKYAEEVNVKVNSLPKVDSVEKVLKYEKAIQKSIFQNLAILKRLQSLP
jgi:hypothetical protein